ncbi:potential E3 ubiquitin-protein ligase ariadne-2 [Caerostris extrusa]|uniref:RBR-type E3 ubiquitin transferase n=1 Tax=Caerostris extrusa TaxID=172846 RepID=A0AAV4VI01_CAEEX|nr:potential E3 ubiquitin-protein ligase ariadne-2 [Caerostris extrusa]
MSLGNSDVELGDSDDDGYCDLGNEDYYNNCEDTEMEPEDLITDDPEYFESTCLSKEDVEKLFNECVESLCASLPVKPSLAKLLLHTHNWETSEIITSYKEDASKLLIDSRIKPSNPVDIDAMQALRSCKSIPCSICLLYYSGDYFRALACGHRFCKDCWGTHFEIQINQGITTTMECQGCSLLVPEDFVLSILNKSCLREKYQQFSFSDYVKSYPKLRFCPGANCNFIVFAKEFQSKRVICKYCKTTFLCPKCSICIEKNGGCNHMQCYSCKFDFCWMCLGIGTLTAVNIMNAVVTRRILILPTSQCMHKRGKLLKNICSIFERWENHARSLRLEEETHKKIIDRINEKVMASEGTWIDWQYLRDAAALLAKCRYTLQYTYPFAYYMESSPRKELFEYQQAQLEAEIENLSWKVERAETTDRGLLTGFISRPERDTGTVSLESVLSSGYSVTTFEPSEFPVRLAHSLLSVPKGTVIGLVLMFSFSVCSFTSLMIPSFPGYFSSTLPSRFLISSSPTMERRVG